MGLLDDLQAEVEKLRVEEHQQSADWHAQEEYYNEYMRPVMVRAYNYFTEIIRNLQIIAPENYSSYPVGPSGQNAVTLKQKDYEFFFDNGKSPRQLDILCNCTLEKSVEFHLPTKEEVLRYTATLESYNFPFHRKNLLDKLHEIRGATFILEGPLKLHIRILASASDRCICINLRNIEDQPSKSYKFSPEAVNEELLERLARLLIREESTLVEVKVCDKVRDDLRRKIELEKRQDKEDLAQAHALIESERSAEHSAKLINRAKRAVVGRAVGFQKVFLKAWRKFSP